MSKKARTFAMVILPVLILPMLILSLGACVAPIANEPVEAPTAIAVATVMPTEEATATATPEPEPTATPEPEPTATPEPEPETDADKVLLQMRWPTDTPIYMSMVMTQTMEQVVFEQVANTVQVMGYDYRYEVLDVSETGDVRLQVTIDGVFMDMTINTAGMTETVRIDSADPATLETEDGQIFAAMVGQGYEIVLDAQGQVIAIDGMDAMMAEMMAAANPEDDPIVAQTMESMLAGFSEERMTESFSSMLPVYSAEPVGIGDSWTHALTMTAPFPMIVNTEYEVADRRDGMVFLDLFGDLEISAEPMEIEGVVMRMMLTGYQSGAAQVDEENALFGLTEITMEMDGYMDFEAGGESFTMPMSASTITIMRIYR